jgi:polar amino acid transport system permease protein
VLEIIRDNWVFLLIGQYPAGPLGGLAMTLILASCGLVLSFTAGLLLAALAAHPLKRFRLPARSVIVFFRGLPLLLLIFWAYFLIPALTGFRVSAFVTMLSALVLYQSAYMAEVIRAALLAVPAGQSDAAAALGFGFTARMTYFIVPQALRAAVPSLINQFVSIIKDTSLGYVISVAELTYVGNQISSSLLTRPFEVFGILALMYFVLCFAIASLARAIDARTGAAASSLKTSDA